VLAVDSSNPGASLGDLGPDDGEIGSLEGDDPRTCTRVVGETTVKVLPLLLVLAALFGGSGWSLPDRADLNLVPMLDKPRGWGLLLAPTALLGGDRRRGGDLLGVDTEDDVATLTALAVRRYVGVDTTDEDADAPPVADGVPVRDVCPFATRVALDLPI
jgi:hypothetical protein